MSKFKVGDKVYIHPRSEYFSSNSTNPVFIKGTVIVEDTGFSIPLRVKWHNGAVNSYSNEDLCKQVPIEEALNALLLNNLLDTGYNVRLEDNKIFIGCQKFSRAEIDSILEVWENWIMEGRTRLSINDREFYIDYNGISLDDEFIDRSQVENIRKLW